MEFCVYEYTNQGGRSYNEDAVGHSVIDGNGIFVVADGLGGHRFGELASACVRDTLISAFNGKFDIPPIKWLERQIALANQNILTLQDDKRSVLKSTVVALTIENGKAVWANVGDSRLYYIHNSTLHSITNDHSVAFKKYKAGEITKAQIAKDEDQSCLLRSLGGKEHNEPEFYDENITIEQGDAFMLCSDGMWEYIADEEVLIDYLKSNGAQQWAERLIMRLMDRVEKNNDNLTILTLMIV